MFIKDFLSNLFSTIGGFIKSFAKTTLAEMAEKIGEETKILVMELEKKPNLTGTEKFNKVKEILKQRYPTWRGAIFDTAIQIAFAIVEEESNKPVKTKK